MQEHIKSFEDLEVELLDRMQARGCTPITVTGYRYLCNSVISWLRNNGFTSYSKEGISIGKLYIDPKNNYIWGKALVKAHKLETEAIYPRVILDSEMEKIIFPEETRIKVDKDNRYFVDYITTIRSLHSEWIDKNKEMIDRDKGSVDDKKVLDKFQWFLQQID